MIIKKPYDGNVRYDEEVLETEINMNSGVSSKHCSVQRGSSLDNVIIMNMWMVFVECSVLSMLDRDASVSRCNWVWSSRFFSILFVQLNAFSCFLGSASDAEQTINHRTICQICISMIWMSMNVRSRDLYTFCASLCPHNAHDTDNDVFISICSLSIYLFRCLFFALTIYLVRCCRDRMCNMRNE